MRTRVFLVAAAIAHVIAQPGLSHGQTPTSWFGTWKLNLARSYAPEALPYKRGTRRIVPSETGGITIIDDLVRLRGGILHLEWTGEFDGRDYQVQGVEVEVTNAYRRVDDRTYELVQKIDGEVVIRAQLLISPDGRTITTVNSRGTARAATIYERQ